MLLALRADFPAGCETQLPRREVALARLATEVELTPVGIMRDDPVTSLAGFHAEGYALFSAREKLLAAFAEVVREGGAARELWNNI